ncbi:hypothetical protein SLE2022_220330 [Rubroshorea leprosula]
MAPSIKQQKLGKDSDSEAPSSSLWVGNLTAETVDSDLMEMFGKYGTLDSVRTYSARSFAFVYFERVEDAKAAKDALQGATLHGNQMKIEFARPAKPCKHLWVGGISSNVAKEELEEEFCKFGKIEDFRFFRDRNTAFVEYLRVDDASQAMRSLNGKRIGGEQIRVDFFRSQAPRRDPGPTSHDLRDGPFSGRGTGDSHSMSKKLHSQLGGRKGDQPSNILWVGYPPSLQIDEQMLHNAMILFGEIERIKSFPSRHYSFVEFRSVEEARRAKEGLQGRLFNDPRITIMFSNSELGPGKDYPSIHSGIKGPRPDAFFNENPFRASQVDIFAHNHPVLPNSFSGQIPLSGVLGPNQLRPLGPQGSYDPLLSGTEYNELAARHGIQDVDPKNLMGPNWRRPSPPLSSPAQSLRPPMRQSSSSLDVYDTNQFQRESKRSRIEASLSVDDLGQGLDRSYGLGPVIDGSVSVPFASVQGKNRLSPVPGRVTAGSPGLGHPDNDYIWRGIIAKGGTPVCHARCVPIGKGIETELPNVVNCSARTGLDMLTKHYAEAIGFDIVFFLPDSEDDFASYTEFLRYLGSKNRAGVAKFDDGTTLFLVPPSDFLTKVLKVMGPERLYGVVLKLPPQVPSAAPAPIHPPLPAQSDYSLSHVKEEQALQIDYGRVLPEDSKLPPPRSLVQSTTQSHLPNNPAAAASQSGVALTPELIATLASLLPTTSQSSTLGGAQSPLASSTTRPLTQTIGVSKGPLSQGWSQDQQAPEPVAHSFQQLGNQFNPSTQLPPIQHYPSIPSTPSHSAPPQMVFAGNQFQESTVGLPQQGAVSSRPPSNFNMPLQTSNIAVTAPLSQQYQPEVPSNPHKGYGMMHGTDASGLYNSSLAFQQPANPNAPSNQVHGANFSQPQNAMQLSADKGSLELPGQVQHLQSVHPGAGQGTSDEVDKNQRYQSTLQFAANLLLQIQQQQQANPPGGQGSGN